MSEVRDVAQADLDACRSMLRQGSKSFHVASLLLPVRVRRPATALYAFCRLADDLIDDADAPADAVAQLTDRIEKAYTGRPHDHPADRALSAVVLRHGLPIGVPLALVEGFAWDAAGRRYETFDDIADYAARVAGSVGVMMAIVMGQRAPDVLARAADLGTAMQLTNIARDVGEDAARGRLYLPEAWLRAEGIEPEAFLRAPAPSPALARIIRRLLEAADDLYACADAGIERLPADCRPGIRAARLIYAAIGAEIRRAGHDGVSRRAVVSRSRKAALMMRATSRPMVPARPLTLPPLAANAFLVEAVRLQPHPNWADPRTKDVAWWNLPGRTVAVIDMFDRLARVERQPLRS